MAKLQISEHGATPQVEVAILEAQGLVDLDLDGALHLERRRARRVDDLQRDDADLDGAARQAGVHRVGGAGYDLAAHREDVLGAHLLRTSVGLGGVRRIEHELHDATAIPQVDEDEPAVVAATGDPAGQADLASDVGGTQLAGIGVTQHQAPSIRRATTAATSPAAGTSSS